MSASSGAVVKIELCRSKLRNYLKVEAQEGRSRPRRGCGLPSPGRDGRSLRSELDLWGSCNQVASEEPPTIQWHGPGTQLPSVF